MPVTTQKKPVRNSPVPVARDGYVMVSAAEYDRLIALANISEAEADIRAGRVSKTFKSAKEVKAYLNSIKI